MEVLLQKEPKIPGTHRITAAISGPRIAVENYGHEALSGYHSDDLIGLANCDARNL